MLFVYTAAYQLRTANESYVKTQQRVLLVHSIRTTIRTDGAHEPGVSWFL